MRFGFTGRSRGPSIYEHIRAHLSDSGLDEGGETLPDEDAIMSESEIALRWAPGALEGAFVRHAAAEDDEAVVTDVHRALLQLADHPDRGSRERAAAAMRRAEPRSHVDAVLERLRDSPPEDFGRLYVEMQAIATGADRREEVKFALAVLGAYGRDEDVELLRTFARHEEFTLYAAVALANIVSDPAEELLELARHVHGWGRVELVELLAREPRPDVCAYLLREGFRNDVLYGYTAQLVAQQCDLAGALESEHDPELIAGARDILATLAADAWGGPAGGMLDYDDGLRATELFFDALAPRELGDYLAVESIVAFLEADLGWAEPDERDELEGRLMTLGWTPEIRAELGERASAVLESPLWGALVQAEIAAAGDELPWEAVEVARRVEVPVHGFLRRHIERNPGDSGAWYQILRDADEHVLDDALVLAAGLFDLESLGAGPASELHRDGVFDVADWLLQRLVEYPGRGWDVIRPALRSPVVRNRHFALKALSGWPADLVTEEVRAAVADVAGHDPDEDVRADARRVLAGEPLDADADADG
jgi:hypothetical protein